MYVWETLIDRPVVEKAKIEQKYISNTLQYIQNNRFKF